MNASYDKIAHRSRVIHHMKLSHIDRRYTLQLLYII